VYTTGDLLKAIEAANGQLNCILSYDGQWKKTYKKTIAGKPSIMGAEAMVIGKGYLVLMNANMVNSFPISGYPKVTQLSMSQGMNIRGITQISSFYSTKELVESIEAGGGNINFILTYDSGSWVKTYKKTIAGKPSIINPFIMKRGMGHLVFMNGAVSNVNPLNK
jgi:hypothetical protein